jgi:hypothetical protein
LGRILVDLIPHVWDSRRAIRLLAEDGSATMAYADPDMQQPMMKQKVNGQAIKIFNFGVGKYDTVTSTGPSYTTKRQEAAEAQVQLAQAVPQLWELGGDIIVRNLDWPGADELADRWKKMLPPGVADDDENLPPEAQAIKKQASEVIEQKDMQIQAAEQGIAERDEALKAAEQKIAVAEADRAVEMERIALERQKLEMEANKPIPVEQDTSELEMAKLMLERERLLKEDEWKRIEIEKEITLAWINANKPANDPEGETEQPDQPQVDTTAIVASALQGLTEALTQMRAPRQIIRDAEGRVQGIQ